MGRGMRLVRNIHTRCCCCYCRLTRLSNVHETSPPPHRHRMQRLGHRDRHRQNRDSRGHRRPSTVLSAMHDPVRYQLPAPHPYPSPRPSLACPASKQFHSKSLIRCAMYAINPAPDSRSQTQSIVQHDHDQRLWLVSKTKLGGVRFRKGRRSETWNGLHLGGNRMVSLFGPGGPRQLHQSL